MFYLVATLVILLMDQGTKFFVTREMQLQESIPVIPNIFQITYILNPGAAFGLFAYQTFFFIIVTLILIVVILYFYRRIPNGYRLLKLGLSFQLGGATGNLLDRLRNGYVVDFLDFRVWPVFNVADMAVVIGMFLIIYELWKREVIR